MVLAGGWIEVVVNVRATRRGLVSMRPVSVFANASAECERLR